MCVGLVGLVCRSCCSRYFSVKVHIHLCDGKRFMKTEDVSGLLVQFIDVPLLVVRT